MRNHSGEIWADIPEYPNYEVSNLGRVRNKERGTFLTANPVKGTNFTRVALWKNGIPKYVGVHRIVARMFLPDFDDRRRVVHIDPEEGDAAFNLEMAPQGCRKAEAPWGRPTSHQRYLHGYLEDEE